jgi:hypothetical protein
MAGKRQTLSLPSNVNSGSFNAGTMLLTDRTVLVNNAGDSNGEFSDAGSDTPLAEVFDPVTFTGLKGEDLSVRRRSSHLTHALEDRL